MEALAKDAVEGYGMHPGSVQLLTKALAAINAEKPSGRELHGFTGRHF